MSHTTFFGRHPLISFLAIALLICGSVAIAGTQIQSDVQSEVSSGSGNTHLIPEHMNPKSQKLSEEISTIRVELRDEVAEVSDTVHSVAFRDHRGQSMPTLDYTTGTSN